MTRQKQTFGDGGDSVFRGKALGAGSGNHRQKTKIQKKIEDTKAEQENALAAKNGEKQKVFIICDICRVPECTYSRWDYV